jgi:hypothetical protein
MVMIFRSPRRYTATQTLVCFLVSVDRHIGCGSIRRRCQGNRQWRSSKVNGGSWALITAAQKVG